MKSDQDLLCVQDASYLQGGPQMWLLHLHVNKKSDDDDDDDLHCVLCHQEDFAT